uniref:(California timema) hypothetical protein n=1 Tax=Timema californicum TaxID=61474 RepID=A0A7R9JEM0_TIMCA|nr:unnamed protein product [Timema californicum]
MNILLTRQSDSLPTSEYGKHVLWAGKQTSKVTQHIRDIPCTERVAARFLLQPRLNYLDERKSTRECGGERRGLSQGGGVQWLEAVRHGYDL